MSPIVIIATLLLFSGIGVLVFFSYYHNRFVRNKHHREDALQSIHLFFSQRQDKIKELRGLLERNGILAPSTLTQADHFDKALESETALPGKAQQLQATDKLYSNALHLARDQQNIQRKPEFEALIYDLEKADDELTGARRYFNALVRENNKQVDGFPSSIVAVVLGHKVAEYLDER